MSSSSRRFAIGAVALVLVPLFIGLALLGSDPTAQGLEADGPADRDDSDSDPSRLVGERRSALERSPGALESVPPHAPEAQVRPSPLALLSKEVCGGSLCSIRELVLDHGWTADELIEVAESDEAARTRAGTNPNCTAESLAILALAWAADFDDETADWLRRRIFRMPPIVFSTTHGGPSRPGAESCAFHALVLRGHSSSLEQLAVDAFERYELDNPRARHIAEYDLLWALDGLKSDGASDVIRVIESLVTSKEVDPRLTFAAWRAAARCTDPAWPTRVLHEGAEHGGLPRSAFSALDDPRFVPHLLQLFPGDTKTVKERHLAWSSFLGLIGIGSAECVQVVATSLLAENTPSSLEGREALRRAGDNNPPPRPSTLGCLLEVQAILGTNGVSIEYLDERIAFVSAPLTNCNAPAHELAGALRSLRQAIPNLPAGSPQLSVALHHLARLGGPEDLRLIEGHLGSIETTPELARCIARLRR